MADPNISNILAALGKHQNPCNHTVSTDQTSHVAAQRSGGTPSQMPSQQMPGATYPPQYGSGPPGGAPGYSLPQPISSVSIADAIAKARGFAAEKGVAYDAARGMKFSSRSESSLIEPQQRAQEIQIQGWLAEVIVGHALRHGPLHVSYGRAFAITTTPTEMSAVVPTIVGMLETGHFLLDLQDASLHQALRAILPRNLGLHQAAAEEERATQRQYQE
jgi:hypothetical protein